MDQSIELGSLVESHIQPFVVIDRNNRVVAVNRAFQQRFGVSVADAPGQYCYSLIAPMTSATRPCPCHADGAACPFDAVFRNNRPVAVDRVMADASGTETRVRVHAFALHCGNGETYLAELIQDLPETATQSSAYANEDKAMYGRSPAFREMRRLLARAAAFDMPVLLQGETGVGKELAARHIHANSQRRSARMVTIDCTVLSEALFESEMFGHERGAFTGSVGEKRGLVELADGGTLFLDEIGELSLPMQAKLLRVLESGEFRRVGGRRDLRADVRLVCATNRELHDASRFRPDLYYRISAAPIRVPRLAERVDDIPGLAMRILEEIDPQSPNRFRLTGSALRRLQRYHYPGNVRELRNLLWSAAAASEDGLIDEYLIGDLLSVRSEAEPAAMNIEMPSLQVGAGNGRDIEYAGPANGHGMNELARLEAGHLSRLLYRYDGNRRRVAKALGVSERTIYRKLRRHNLN